MTPFDYGVLVVLTISVLLGLWRGVVSELLSLVAWVIAFIAARTWAEVVSDMLSGSIADPALRHGAAFILVFVLVLVLMAMARFLVRELLRAVGLGFVDRILGAVFGIARGMLLVMVGVLVAGLTALPRQSWWRGASFSPPLETAVLASRPWLPPELAKRIHYR